MNASLRNRFSLIRPLRRADRLLCRLPREELTPAGQWLRDNARALYGQASALRGAEGLLRRREFARLRGVCERLAAAQHGVVRLGALCRAVNAAAEDRPWTVRELRALPDLLALCLLRRLCGLLPALLAEHRAWQAGKRLAAVAAADRLRSLPQHPVALWRAVDLLSAAGDIEGARRLDSRLRADDAAPQALAREAQQQLADTAAAVSEAIIALLSLPQLDGGLLVERCSAACAALRRHSGFGRMDRASRALYLSAASRLSRRLRAPETRVCEAALALSAGREGAQGDPGFYLLEDPSDLCRALGRRPVGLPPRLRAPLYALALALAALLSGAAGFAMLSWPGALPFAFLGAEGAHRWLERLCARLLPRRALPRLKRECLPPGTRALVALPTVLLGREHALRMCRQLSALYLANEKAPVDFLLLCDYTDADGADDPADEETRQAAKAGVQALRAAYGARFFYLQRRRSRDAEGRWYGHERKRGALLLLCRLLCGQPAGDPLDCCDLPEELAGRYTHVITLDSDTFLPAGAAEKLLGAMLHPLQRGRVAVIQPRMLTLPLHVRTHAQAVLGGESGADGYSAAAASLYQDAFGRGSFMGKGILEPQAFLQAVSGLPEGRILSHDLLEGELAGSALASDIVCYDGHPRRVAGFLRRAHRWTRGDWQLLPFLADRRLDLLSRLKLWDNLRRSLTPCFRLLALALAAGRGAWLPFLLAALPLGSPATLVRLCLLPAEAFTRLDAAFRALWRLLVSRKRLLEWTTAAQAEQGDASALRASLPPLACGGALLFAAASSAFGPGFALGMAWLAGPLLSRWLDRPRAQTPPLSAEDEALLREAARRTMAFFRAHVNARTHDLPPDNVQLSPPRGAATRTSPTNIGLYLLSLCAGCELGLVSAREMLARMERTCATLERLVCWHGIPYNWYDVETLAPLSPRYVSSVDAGNLLCCLLAAAQAARAHMEAGESPALQALPARLDALARRMQLSRLYDRKAQLFRVGFDAQSGRMSAGHYDLLASEAQLLSFAAIALGHAPQKHWWRLGRPWARANGRVLLSWSGTMFEYLLPALLLPAYEDSALQAAQRGCVRAQRRAGRGAVFGVSESGCAQLGPQLDYRYQAFGARALALDAEAAGDVYAPYAAALALRCDPAAACRALRAMQQMGAWGEHGFYEAVDCAGPQPRVVFSHMAHHQGMLLCAICNALCGDALVRAFTALPRVQAQLPLLNELPPRRVPRLPRPLRAHRDAPAAAPFRMRAQRGDALLLSGGGTSLLCDHRGHARLFRDEGDLTRFDARAGALSGPQIYLCGAGDAPARLTGGEYTFLDGAYRCDLALTGLRSEVRAFVEPVSGAAVWAVRLRSTAAAPLRLRAVLYLEPALAPAAEDAAHPAFSDLFLTVTPAGENACVARRRPRDGGPERTLTARAWAQGQPLRCELCDDRALVLGREGSVEAPLGLEAPFSLTQARAVCLALRAEIELGPGQSETLCFAVGAQAPETLEQALRGEALSAARRMAERKLLLPEAHLPALACRLAGQLLYRRDAIAPGSVRALWALGVSGDVPLLAVEAESERDLPALRLTARLLAWLCQHGAQAELVFLLPRESGYTQPLRACCEGLALQPQLRALHGRTRVMNADEAAPLRHLCDVYLRASLPLAPQLAPTAEGKALFPASPGGGIAPLPPLSAWNGFGGFLPEGAYAVCGTAPAPWCHIVCNEGFGTLLCEQGILYSYAGNSRLRRLTRPCMDSVVIQPSEEYFVLEDGQGWSLTRRPLQNAESRAVYEMGAAVYSCALPGLSAELTCFADPEWPCGGRTLRLRNTGDTLRSLTVLGAARFFLGEDGRGTHAQAAIGCALARGGGMAGAAFFALEGAQVRAASGAAYGLGERRCPDAADGGSVGILEKQVLLRPGEAATLCFCLGYCEQESDVERLLSAFSPARERLARAAWRERLERLRFYLPDGLLSGWLNGFLPYQVRASRVHMRAGFSQPGGAWGFRDQLQDMLSLVYTEPQRVRAHLLRCASRQYVEGDVQHWWHPEGAGVRTRVSDDRLFLPYVTARYVAVTGDAEVLNARVPYLVSPALSPGERDRYETAEAGPDGTLLEHCLRAIGRVEWGAHGLPEMEGGDWNDGMDAVGGESAWLGFFRLMVLRDFAPLCPPDVRDALDRERIRLHGAMQAAWTGRWYLRAWYRDGRTLGAPDSEVPRIDLISQCFAAFAGMPRTQVRQALDAAWDLLHRPREGVTLLLTPPFTPSEKAGYIGAYIPGVRENGGQYTHALPWFMRALLQTGQNARAWQLLRECVPWAHSATPEAARHYRAEPYVLAADVTPEGRGGWTWYTGSAGWLYEVFLRDFLGFEKLGDSVRLAPRVPEDWEECTLLYRYGESRYELTAAADAPYVTLDGEKIVGAFIPLRDDGRAHEARFPLQRGGDA